MTSQIEEECGPRTGHLQDGTTGRPLVVLLHGSGSSAGDWDAVRRRLDGRIASLAPDRGTGPVRRRAVTAPELAADLQALLDVYGRQPPYVLVGHSWGGAVARAFAQSAPEDVAALVLVDATHESLATLRSHRFRLAQRLAAGAARLPVTGGRGLAALREVAGLRSSLDHLRPPTVPTWTLVGGRASTAWQLLVRRDFAETYRRVALSGSVVRHRIVATAGHDVPTEAPDAVVATVMEALAFVEEGTER